MIENSKNLKHLKINNKDKETAKRQYIQPAGKSVANPKDKLFELFCSKILIRSLQKQGISLFNPEQDFNQAGQIQSRLSLTESFLFNQQSLITLDQRVLSQIWTMCLQAQIKDSKQDKLEGYFETKYDYTAPSQEFKINIENFSQSSAYFKNLRYYCQLINSEEKSKYVNNQVLLSTFADIVKKLKNANMSDKFYQAQLSQALDNENPNQQNIHMNKFNFEADSQNITVLDFMRVLFTIDCDQARQKLIINCHLIVPDLAFNFIKVPKVTIISTPLSRMLLGRNSADDKQKIQSNFREAGLMYSGFVSIDQDKRIYPLMPNDPESFNSSIVGLWFYGISDINCQYVWAACARFVFCRNFKDKGKLSISKKQTAFIIVGFNQKQYPQFYQVQAQGDLWKIISQNQKINRETQLQFKSFTMSNLNEQRCFTISDYIKRKTSEFKPQKDIQVERVDKNMRENEVKQHRRQISSANPLSKGKIQSRTERDIIPSTQNQKVSQYVTLDADDQDQFEVPKPAKFNMAPFLKDSIRLQCNDQSNEKNSGNNTSLNSSSNPNRSRNSQSKKRLNNQQEQAKELKLSQQIQLTKNNLEYLNKQSDDLRTSKELQIQQLLQSSQKSSRSRSNKNQLLQKQEMLNLDAPIRNSFEQHNIPGYEQIHSSPRSLQIFIDQQNHINHLSQQMVLLNQQVQNLTLIIQQQQIHINNQQQQYSQTTTAYQTQVSHSNHNSISANQQQNTNNFQVNPPPQSQYSSVSYSNAVQDQYASEGQNMMLISQPTAEFPLQQSIHSQFQSNQLTYQQRYELGQIETLGRFDHQQFNQQIIHQSQEEEEAKQRRNSDNSLIEDQEIPLPDRSMGEKRSRNQRKTKQQHQIEIPRQSTHQHLNNNNFLQNLQEAEAQLNTLSEISKELSGSNQKLRRSQSSMMSNATGNELNAIKTNLKNQYEDQLAATRPKASRNVLNNVNKQVKNSSKSSSSSSRSRDSDSDDENGVDHTYNPYSFKKIEQAIFKRKPTTDNIKQGNTSIIKEQPRHEEESSRKKKIVESENEDDDESEEEKERQKIIVQLRNDRQGKTDWTMDLPKIQYAADDEDDDDEDVLSNNLSDDDDDMDSDDDKEFAKKYKPSVKISKNAKTNQDSDDDKSDILDASSIARVEKKYIKH
ncbi:UNKNOWN [Stylonychia lemnae]|uniref:STIL N-terminal domain-containing protein n=1 Tax=Stylonychia lemnae TaxID=5949 RepID=A0A078AFS6_STYLE|nr:UNKNOWN [Stylonychia lemnae]|eukprot:CDW79743.1 UNKNOWN [Stylonychia lemnae]